MAVERWQLQEAKNRFSEVVRRARQDGPQIITFHGHDAVVIMDVHEYERLTDRRALPLVDFFQASPLVGEDLDLTRSTDAGRTVDL